MVDKATKSMVTTVAIATFVTIFAIFSGHSISKVLSYQNRVIGQQNIALSKLNQDVKASQQLESSYSSFNTASGNNLLGASITGSGSNTGDNAKIVLDALPSTYDFPALATSLQSLLSNRGVAIGSIGGTDQSAATTTPTPSTTNIGSAIPIPISFSVTGNYQNIQNLIGAIEKSIRPFQIQTLSLSGGQSSLTLSVTAQTYYQAEAKFNVTTEVVK